MRLINDNHHVIKLKTEAKKKMKGLKEFIGKHSIRFSQCFKVSSKPTWVVRWSHDSKHMATGGQDGVLRIWRVIQI